MDDRLRRVLARHRSGIGSERVRRLGEGLDNVAYEVDDAWVLRFTRDPDRTVVEREAAVLTVVGRVSPLPVPVPAIVDADEGCLAYRRLPGTAALDLAPPLRRRLAPDIAAQLGAFLAVLHAVPVAEVAALVEPDTASLSDWRADAAAEYAAVVDHVPGRHRAAVEAFLAAPPPAPSDRIVFSHNDLGVEHVLVDPGRAAVVGVIDWTDAALTDPAYDLALVLRDLGPAALETALAHYGRSGAGLVGRAGFYARCSVFEDLRHGVEAGRPPYVETSLAALTWLFPAGR